MLAGRLAPQFAGVIGIDADECMAAAASARADRRRRLESTALSRAETGCAVWRSPIQEHLDISMNGMRILLPRCRELAQPLGPVLLAARDDERTGLVARMAMGAATEVEQRPELYAPVMDPLADVRPHRATG